MTRPARGGELTRTALARELCERESWRGPSGRPCLASARRMLPPLAEALGVHLPEAETPALDPHMRPPSDFPDSSVACALCDLGALSLDLVTDAADRRRWEAMVETHHPKGWRRPPGGQLRYWIRSEWHGILGGVGFAAAGIQLGPRDGVIGWSADARVANIGKVVCNNRFLLLSGVRVKGLASRALRLATARVADDWATGYGERPVLAQTFTGPEMSGLSYRVAGWKCCPELTSGRRSGVRRAVWLRPLAEGWREVLRRRPERVLGWSDRCMRRGDGPSGSMAGARTPDGRVRSRIAQMGAAWTRRLGAHLPSIFPGQRCFSGIAFAAVAVYALTGCAAKPENIAALPVSQVRYAKLSCPELRIEREVVEQRLAALSNRQRSNRTRDGLLNFLLPGLGAATPDQEGLIAQAKGEINTIERESILRCQTVPTR